MKHPAQKAVAIVGVGAVMPDAPTAPAFWQNIKQGRYCVSEVPASRWDHSLYYDPDPRAPDKTYSKIGGWVREFEWDPLRWRLPIPPRVGALMDLTQKWAVAASREALQDYGYPNRPLNPERTAVILGNAMAGDQHLYSATRILFPEYTQELQKAPSFASLPPEVRRAVIEEMRAGVGRRMPEITEDTMPGELANIIAGRIAALYDFKGPNYVADAACASAMAGMSAALEGLTEHDYDAVVTGGIDANMSPSTFVKFCKIGALSATGTRPYAEGADGFVMGEGAAVFLLKRLEDAERDGDRIYAVIRSLGGSSDGKGRGITAPNPVGQKLAVFRAWEKAGCVPQPGDMIEGHGTSTKVGDVVEVESLAEAFASYGLPAGALALGSVKSNIGHLKGAAGAAGIFKAAMALHEKVLPPSLNFTRPNPGIDFSRAAFRVNTELSPWQAGPHGVRRCGVSAFGFGGTNFHGVLEEYIPGRVHAELKSTVSVPAMTAGPADPVCLRAPLRGALVLGGADEGEVARRLEQVLEEARAGKAAPPAPPSEVDLRAPVRLAIDYGDASVLADKAGRALKALQENQAGRWKALRAKGIFLGKGPSPKVAFLFSGQGSQYVNMMRELRQSEPLFKEIFDEADRVMTPLLGKSLSDCIYLDESDAEALAAAEEGLKQTAITQPAVLATETAISRLLGLHGITPDMVMGHSLGEYGALVAAGCLPFADALRAVSARGQEMTRCSMDDNGIMAAVSGPVEKIEEVLSGIDGYVVVANINSSKENVIGGSTEATEKAMAALRDAGLRVQQLQVSHAFHTSIVAAAGEGLVRVLQGIPFQPPSIPIISNVTGDFYPMGPDVVPGMIERLGRQVASPVQFVKGLETLYQAGARVFVEIGPKRILYGFVEDVLGDREGVWPLFTNHPRIGEAASLNLALCGLYAAGLGFGAPAPAPAREAARASAAAPAAAQPAAAPVPAPPVMVQALPLPAAPAPSSPDRYVQLGKLFADFLDRSFQVFAGGRPAADPVRIGITGAALGLPGVDRIFDDSNVARILRGDQFIGPIPMGLRQAMIGKNIHRLIKTSTGEGHFETISDVSEAIKLAARARELDLVRDFGFPEDRLHALDYITRLAIAAGIDAMRDAGIPMVMRYKKTTRGTQLPDRWMLPDSMRDDTGVLFVSAFPGYDSYTEIISGFYRNEIRRRALDELSGLRESVGRSGAGAAAEIDRRIAALEAEIEREPYVFDRRFLFRVLSMGHSQFAEYIGARGPNTATNAACASTTQAVALASDWIQTGRCRRVIVISADDITSDNLMEWFGAGFLASGAAATDDVVEEAAIPFDKRRHGLLIGMGGAALVLESFDSASERGLVPICELIGTVVANSAYHGSRLDVSHICTVMERLIADAEARWGIRREEMAAQTVFVSHETYTPARGGSASAEVFALRHVFRELADRIIVANTKGATGHPMAVGIEDVVGVKILETGIVPPVANFREVDPELGVLNLARGGFNPATFVLRLGAGFGSQIAMTLTRWTPPPDGRRRDPNDLGFAHRIADRAAWELWLRRATGYDTPELEVAQRTLRVKDSFLAARNGAPANSAAAAETPPPARPSLGVQAVPAAAAQLAAAAPTSAADAVRTRVMQIIAEKTGYPTDMLDLDLDLEADLGIDTVKQAEMFAAIRAAYDIPREDNLKLRDFPTLAHAIRFVYDRRPDLVAAPEPAQASAAPSAGLPAPSPEPAARDAADSVRSTVIGIIAEKTGYPTDMLDLDLDLEADLGIDTVKQAEMFAAIRAAYDIPREDNLKLRDFPTLAHAIRFVYDRRPDLEQAPVAPQAHAPAPASGPPPAAEPAQTAARAPIPEDQVREAVLGIIAEKTGYPPDMLDLDLDLEADLGIDTVKQAEMFAAIRAAYDIPRDDNLKLRDFPTLKHTIQFVYDRRPDLLPTPAAPQAAATPPAAPAVVAPAPAGTEDPVKEAVLRIIAEKTGYPPDMLDLDLDLEADLGVDTVKQAEMFAAIRAAYDIPRDDNLKLRDFPTLKHTIQFVYDRKPELKGAAQSVAAEAPVQAEAARSLLAGDMDAAAALPRRVPVPRLRPGLDLCRPTGVALGKGSRVVLVPDLGGVGKALASRLEKLGVEVLAVEDAPDAESLAKRLQHWKEQGPVQGVYWLPALDAEGDPAALERAAWQEAVRTRVKLLYTAMRELYDQVGGSGTFLVSATRLGGQHGYDDAGALGPLGGAVSGFTKTYKREKPESLVKVVDFEASRKTTALADLLIAETLSDPGIVEVGYKSNRRWTVGLEERPLTGGPAGMMLGEDTVFVITGAAGSIVSAITADLAAASGGTFHLLDLAPAPDPASTDLARFSSDKEGLKRDIFERLKQRGERATPALVEKEMAGLERMHAALAAIQAVQRAGGTAHYYSLNLLDGEAVARAVGLIAERSGRVDVLLHAAGLEISRFLPDKKPAEFDLVFDVKAGGWYNLLSSMGPMPLGAAVAFCSIAGRFGNGGQSDYSAANDFLAKCVSNFRSSRPATRGIAVDWTGWGGIGMAARGSIPQILKQAGIDLLPPEAGIPFIRRELTAGSGPAEVVVAQGLGIMLEEFDPAGGLSLGEGSLFEGGLLDRGIMTGRISGMGLYSGLTIETELDPAAQPFLYDHQIGGTPVLPGVMGIEALAEAARVLFPGLYLAELEDVRFQAPFKFYRGQPRTVTLRAHFSADGDAVTADCSLVGARTLHGQSRPEITTHFTGRVRLSPQAPKPLQGDRPPKPTNGRKVESGKIYRLYFHGPAYQVLESSWRAGEGVVGLFPDRLPANHKPADMPTVAEPRLIELCFQTAGIWEMAVKARMGLPYSIGRVRVFGSADSAGGRLCGVAVPRDDGSFDARVVDENGRVYVMIEGYRTMEVPDPIDAAALQPLKDCIGDAPSI